MQQTYFDQLADHYCELPLNISYLIAKHCRGDSASETQENLLATIAAALLLVREELEGIRARQT